MARGRTSIIFKGGEHNGLEYHDVALPLPNRIRYSKGVCFAGSLEKDDIQIIKFSEKLPNNWISYSVDVYVKEEKENKRKLGSIYKYKGEEMVNRCEATTQKGTLCKHNALDNDIYCGAHKKIISK